MTASIVSKRNGGATVAVIGVGAGLATTAGLTVVVDLLNNPERELSHRF